MDKIEREICKSYNIQRRLSENQYDFVLRALRVVGDPENGEKWNMLSDTAKEWYNESVSRIEKDELPLNFSKEFSHSDVKDAPGAAMYRRGAGWRAKEILLENNMDIRPMQVLEQLQKEGYDYSISTLRVDVAATRQLVKILKHKDMLREPEKIKI